MITRRTALAAIYGAAHVPCLADSKSGLIELPTHLNNRNQIVIAASVNGGPQTWYLLDTGGSNNVYLSPKKAAELGIAPTSAGMSSGENDIFLRRDARARVTLDTGTLHLADQSLLIKEVIECIGAAVFADFIVELDYQTPAVRLHSPASFDHQGPGIIVPFYLGSNNPRVIALLSVDGGEPVKARMSIDSGAAGSAVCITPRFRDELHRQGRELPWVFNQKGDATCHIDRVAVGMATMDNPLVFLLPVQGFGGAPDPPDGLLGVEFLHRYRVFLDYLKKRMILEPISTAPSRSQ